MTSVLTAVFKQPGKRNTHTHAHNYGMMYWEDENSVNQSMGLNLKEVHCCIHPPATRVSLGVPLHDRVGQCPLNTTSLVVNPRACRNPNKMTSPAEPRSFAQIYPRVLFWSDFGRQFYPPPDLCKCWKVHEDENLILPQSWMHWKGAGHVSIPTDTCAIH